MSPDDLQTELIRRTLARLREALDLHYAAIDEVLALCEVQLRNGRFSKAAVRDLMASFPPRPADQAAWFNSQVAEAVAELLAAGYVADCERVAQFLHPETDQAARQRITDEYRYNPAYRTWMYGGRVEEEEGHCRERWGALGARLIAALGKSEAAIRFAQAQTMVEEKVFALDALAECVAEYRPRLGMKFENFLKRRFNWRAGDVAKWMRRRPPPGADPRTRGQMELDAILHDVSDGHEEDAVEDLASAFRGYLEQCRRRRDDLEIAAFELRYKAYWAPDQMTAPTRRLVEPHLERLDQEFRACQEELRELEVDMSDVQYKCEVAWRDVEQTRRQLDQAGCSPRLLGDLESQATQRTKGDLKRDLDLAKGARRSNAEVLRLQYMLDYKSLALARGRRENARKLAEKWDQCRLPWVRSERYIAALIDLSQSSVSRAYQGVKNCLSKCLGVEL